MLGERNRFYKSVPYTASVQIPMVIAGADIRKGVTCDAFVQLSDLAQTIAEIADTSMPKDVDSFSLLSLATDKNAKSSRDYITSALYPSKRKE
ncbi:MAG: hypothetical protein MJ089_08985 [Ruminococcus sp.]|nr:hypothetical protein [Ruminococcus sp.]